MNRRRLDVEAWRDAMLAVAGRLDPKLGGPSVSLDRSANERRTFYAAISRHDLAWMLRLFDFPDPNITSGGRVETIVPLQQLFVLNSEFMIANARAVVARLDEADASWIAPRGRRTHPAGLSAALRPAGDRARTDARSAISATEPTPAGSARTDMSRWDRYAQALLATNEFLFID